jgi:hypothetical protein
MSTIDGDVPPRVEESSEPAVSPGSSLRTWSCFHRLGDRRGLACAGHRRPIRGWLRHRAPVPGLACSW